MGSLSDFAENAMLEHVFETAFTPTVPIYVALCTADPTDAATGASMNECANSGNYAREQITFGAYASRKLTQSGALTFNTASGSWGTVTHWAMVNSGTYGSGDVLCSGAFASGKSIVNGNTPSIADASLYIQIDAGYMSNYLVQKLLELVFKNVAYSRPDTYVALCTSDCADTDTDLSGKECANQYSYARELVDENGGSSPTWIQVTGTNPTYVDNAADVDLGPASGGSWGTITAMAICDSGTWNGGNMLMYDNGLTEQAVGDGDTATFPTGDLEARLA